MLKKDLVRDVALACGQPQDVVRAVFDGMRDVVVLAMAAGVSVMTPIGKLSTRRRGEKRSRNLHTGEPVVVPPRTVATLRPSAGVAAAANQAVPA
jgi:nucleoid DNA-binding protein